MAEITDEEFDRTVAVFERRNPHIEAELLCDIRAERLGRPEEIANAVLWLCSPQVGFVDGHAGGRHILYSLNYQNIKRWKQTKK